MLQLRPAIRVSSGGSQRSTDQDLGTVEYDATFEVSDSDGWLTGAWWWVLTIAGTVGCLLTAGASYVTIQDCRRRHETASS